VSNPFVAKFAPPAFSDAWKAEDGVPTLLFVGRLMHEKGVMDLLEAVGLMKASQPCRLWIVGSGPLHADATRRSSELGLGERVHLRGYLEGEELMNAYRTADLFVLPTYWAEGFPTVITEAMSMGLPIITTRLRGTADHLRAGDNVLFVPPRNPEKLAGAISSVLGDVELRSRMYSENLKKVAEFDPHQVARAYLDALAEVSDWTRAPVMNGANGEK
jgi:glycosyltransferase involved in cell wall biosynthesis